ncbi:hypothetical protein D0N36_04070 [Hymenobacter lapidiphilus]|uniref:hypothetical protein n=1 Tax=Hymenobacter sp. CCM 8763 TaxID=2303334 RepID=UPI000E342EE1|nr:hypothetical protein [Hymenobacter sp. CCM 8763]RFP66205.1 hypothetical protein D0N36_04070 [Hymenobacter sp. CCM 8763]
MLLNANDSKDHITGLALQMRYYVPQSRNPAALTGFYVAPTLSTRRVKQSDRVLVACYGTPNYTPGGRSRALGGAGLLVGRQTPIGQKKRVLVDASVGLMSWQPWDKSAAPYGCPGYSNDFTKYERHTLVPDGRLSLGYRF